MKNIAWYWIIGLSGGEFHLSYGVWMETLLPLNEKLQNWYELLKDLNES